MTPIHVTAVYRTAPGPEHRARNWFMVSYLYQSSYRMDIPRMLDKFPKYAGPLYLCTALHRTDIDEMFPALHSPIWTLTKVFNLFTSDGLLLTTSPLGSFNLQPTRSLRLTWLVAIVPVLQSLGSS